MEEQPVLLNTLDPNKQLVYGSGPFDRLTHYLFRFPAKFHPPVVKALISQYSGRGDWILDPFCGSGTMLVEAAIAGRNAVGSDLDPVATFISRVKTHRYDTDRLSISVSILTDVLAGLRRSDQEYYDRRFRDITTEELYETISQEDLWVPEIPNLLHWFRRYVVVDLARIHQAILRLQIPRTHKDFLFLCFASIIRASSNADPVPVSGLEVTSYMRRKEALGRIVDPYRLLEGSIKKAINGIAEYRLKVDRMSRVAVKQVNVLDLASRFRRTFDAIITSPPYHNAVDYYRRHKLEMFWLGFTETQADRLSIMRGYLGRSRIAQSDMLLNQGDELEGLSAQWEARIRASSIERADSFRHYAISMKFTFEQFGQLIEEGKPVVVVVGHSGWNGTEIPTADLFEELAAPNFKLSSYSWYPIKNRYMSYSRRNGANIDKERVLVMHKVNSNH